jgi:hypothetical protein
MAIAVLGKISNIIEAGKTGRFASVENYRNRSAGGDKHVLQNWNTLEVQLGTSTYTISLGYDSDSIEASVNRLSSTP